MKIIVWISYLDNACWMKLNLSKLLTLSWASYIMFMSYVNIALISWAVVNSFEVFARRVFVTQSHRLPPVWSAPLFGQA